MAAPPLYLAALALLSLGIGALLRHTAAAISTVTALLVVPVFFVELLPEHISDRVLQLSPMTAGLAIQRSIELPDSVPIDPWVGLGVACLWALARDGRRAMADRAARRLTRSTA